MSARFVDSDRNTPLLLPPDLRDWIPDDDMVHFVIESANRVGMDTFQVNERGTGDQQYHPHMMLALLIYCYSNGIFGSRRIERATYRDIAVRYITADKHPDHDTIASFRRNNYESFVECFVKVLELARELKVLKLGTVSIDGSKIKANASKDKNVTYKRAGELSNQLRQDVLELTEKAEQADNSSVDDGQSLPSEINRLSTLKEKLDNARAEIERRAEKRAEKDRGKYELKVKKREERSGSCKGKKIKVPESTARDDEQCNLSDHDSRLMRKNKKSGYMQAYNAQAAVDAEGSQLILGSKISQCASDRNELVPGVESIPSSLGKADKVLADNGYANGEDVKVLEDEGVEVYVSVHREEAHERRKYDFRPDEKRKSAPPKAPPNQKEWVRKMGEKLKTEEGRKIYAKRKHTVEPVFGIIKEIMGFRQFHLRGLENVTCEWHLVSLAYNCKRLFNIIGRVAEIKTVNA